MLENILTFLFAGVLLIQLLFIIFVFGRLAFYNTILPPYRNKKKMKTEGISVIVAAHNEYENLKNLIPSLINQAHDNYEIIIVNDRSSDNSIEYLKEQSSIHNKLNFINIDKTPEKQNSKKHALKTGIEKAKNDILLLTDADCIPISKEWINEIQKAYFDNKQMVLGYSQYKKLKGFLNSFIRFETLYTGIQYLSLTLSGMPYMGVGRNISYKKKIFENNNGYAHHKHITGGDDDLFTGRVANYNNTNIVIKKESQTVSIPKENLKEWIVQKKRHLSVSRHYQKKHIIVLSLLNFSHIYFYIFLLIMSILEINISLLITGYLLRMFSQVFIFYKISHKLEDKISILAIPLFDLIYVVYISIIGVNAIFTKNLKWK